MDKLALIVVLASIGIGLAGVVSFGIADKGTYPDLPIIKGTACYTNWWFKGNASDVRQSVLTCPDPVGNVSVEQLCKRLARGIGQPHERQGCL